MSRQPRRSASRGDRRQAVERAISRWWMLWGMQDLIRKMPRVRSTGVGYSCGDIPNATYRNHGTHAEAIEIVFDPKFSAETEWPILFQRRGISRITANLHTAMQCHADFSGSAWQLLRF